MKKTIDNCQLEIDTSRGVIYVHGPQGITLLRICSLPTPIPVPCQHTALDITHMAGVNWKKID